MFVILNRSFMMGILFCGSSLLDEINGPKYIRYYWSGFMSMKRNYLIANKIIGFKACFCNRFYRFKEWKYSYAALCLVCNAIVIQRH